MVKFFAYIHRYVFPICIVLVPVLLEAALGKNCLLLFMGIGFLLMAAYDLIGYQRRWKHIYCSFQNAHRKKMTPHCIHWSDVRKSEIYGTSAICGIVGILLIAGHILWVSLPDSLLWRSI